MRSTLRISGEAVGKGFLSVCCISLLVLFAYLQYTLAFTAISFPFKILSCLSDAGLLMIPVLFLKKGWRYLILPVVGLFALLVFANIIYFRNFGDMIAPSLYFSDFNNGFVVRSAAASIKWKDLWLVVAVLLPIIYPCVFGWKASVDYLPARRFKLSFIIIVALCWIIGYVGEIRRIKMFTNSPDYIEATRTIFNKSHIDWQSKYRQHNFTGYLTWTLYESFGIYHTLSLEEKASISEYLEESNQRFNVSSASNNDTGSYKNKSKNLIIIVVESLPSSVFNMKDASQFMPTLVELTTDSTNIFVKDCDVLAGLGRSSDAQFLINTGLTPLHHEVLVTNYASGNYPALAKAFKGNSMEVIGEYSSLWSHGLTNKAYGFDGLISGIAVNRNDQDSIIFRAALEEIRKMKNPFFMFISSISMHNPYLTRNVSDELPPEIEADYPDARDREYLRRLLHFDRSLADFLEELKKAGKYDDSVIVITGDHEIAKSDVSAQFFKDSVPMIILNSGKTEYRKEGVTQLDIFPTILDTLGLEYVYERFDVPYRGLGKSLFAPGLPYLPTDKDYQISELIIRAPV